MIMARKQFTWTDRKLIKLDQIEEVLNEWRKYWPLTLRQIYYQLVSKQIIQNKDSEYKSLSLFLKWARLDNKIPWNAMEDRVRSSYHSSGYDNKIQFINSEFENFLTGYYRHLISTQDVHIEVWIEKDALSSIFSRITKKYCISTIVCRGFSSVTFLNDYKDRISQNGKQPIMLYFGDFDPSGMEMLESMEITLLDEMGAGNISFKRIALTKEDINFYNLPHDPSAVKKSDSRYNKFVEKYGEYAVELDALDPDVLEQKIVNAIENELDMAKFQIQVEQQDRDFDEIDDLRNKVNEMLSQVEF